MPTGRPSPRAASRTSGRRTARGAGRPSTISRPSRPATSSRRSSRRPPAQPMQGFVLNLRRPQFQDRRVRQALTYAFDFESMNRTLFYRLQHAHRQLLRGRRTGVQRPAARQGAGNPEPVQGQAAAGTLHAGVQAAGLRHAAGRARSICARPSSSSPRPAGRSRAASWSTTRPASSSGSRFLGNDPTDERSSPLLHRTICASSASTPSLRIVDPANMSTASAISTSTCVTAVLAQSQFARQRAARLLESARPPTRPARATYAGIKNPVVDALVDRVIFATDRDDLVAATHALDRVLLVELLRRSAIAPAESSGSPTGTSSAFPKSSRPISAPTSNPGGSTRKRKARWRPNTRAATDAARHSPARLSGAGAARALAAPLLPGPAFAGTARPAQPLHGLSAFGDLKYPAGLHAFRLCQPGRAEGRDVQLRSRPTGSSTRTR